jgi:hypothetical protein
LAKEKRGVSGIREREGDDREGKSYYNGLVACDGRLSASCQNKVQQTNKQNGVIHKRVL